MAGAQGRIPVLGERCYRRNSRRYRQSYWLRKDYARYHGTTQRAGGVGPRSPTTRASSEDGSARSAHWRRRARFQQSAHGGERSGAGAYASIDRSEKYTFTGSNPDGGLAWRGPDATTAHIRPQATAKSPHREPCPNN